MNPGSFLFRNYRLTDLGRGGNRHASGAHCPDNQRQLMQAIQTKVIPATNTKPTRIMAKCARGKCFFSTTHLTVEVGSVEAHREAAQALVARFIKEDEKQFGTTNNPWAKPFVTGCLPDGSMAHVWPHVETSILIQVKDSNDAKYIRNYKTDADQRDGTVAGVSAGLMCSALKRATI